MKTKVLRKALDSAKLIPIRKDSIQEEANRLLITSQISYELLDSKQIREILYEANGIKDNVNRSRTLVQISKLPINVLKKEILIKEVLEEAFLSIKKVQDAYSKTELLLELYDQLPHTLKADAQQILLNSVMDIQDDASRARLLIQMAQRMPEEFTEMLQEFALDSIMEIPDNIGRAEALAEISNDLPLTLRKRAIDNAFAIAIKIKDASRRLELLDRMSQNLVESKLRDALRVAMEIQDEKNISNALDYITCISTRLILEELLNLLKNSETGYKISSVTEKVNNIIKSAIFKKTLEKAIESKDLSYWIDLLAQITYELPESYRDGIIKVCINTIEDSD